MIKVVLQSVNWNVVVQILSLATPVIVLIVGYFLDRNQQRKQFRRNKCSELYDDFLMAVYECELEFYNDKAFVEKYKKATLACNRLGLWASEETRLNTAKVLETLDLNFLQIQEYQSYLKDYNNLVSFEGQHPNLATEEEKEKIIDQISNYNFVESNRKIENLKNDLNQKKKATLEEMIKEVNP